MATITPELLRSRKELHEDLFLGPEFEVVSAGDREPLTVTGIDGYETVGADGSGGVFVVVAPKGYVLFVDLEGSAGVVGENLTLAIETMAALPHWRDVLNFSGGGKLDEMRRADAPMGELMLDYDPDAEESRERLHSALDLTRPDDPVAMLHHAVSKLGAGIAVLASDGTPYGSLFNTFRIDDWPGRGAA